MTIPAGPMPEEAQDASRYDVAAAADAIRSLVVETPVLYSRPLSDIVACEVYLKLENLQVTGSFKARGAANRLLALSPRQRSMGVVACSSGNHGRAVAYVAERLGMPATICVPDWVDPVKLDAIRRHGADAVLCGGSYDEAEATARSIHRDRGVVYVDPFDDPDVIAGQGTVALELLAQLPDVQSVIVPLSGGGLISGIAVAVKSRHPETDIIAVSADHARVMYESQRAGHPITFPETRTVASALSGGIGADNRHTFALVRRYVDEHHLVSDDRVKEAMVFAAQEHGLIVEGGGAVGIAALLGGEIGGGGRVVVVVSGGNVDLGLLAELASAPCRPVADRPSGTV